MVSVIQCIYCNLFLIIYTIIFFRFYRATHLYASAVLGVVIFSFRPSHACFPTNPKNLQAIFLYHMKGQSFYFSATQHWLVDDVPST